MSEIVSSVHQSLCDDNSHKDIVKLCLQFGILSQLCQILTENTENVEIYSVHEIASLIVEITEKVT